MRVCFLFLFSFWGSRCLWLRGTKGQPPFWGAPCSAARTFSSSLEAVLAALSLEQLLAAPPRSAPRAALALGALQVALRPTAAGDLGLGGGGGGGGWGRVGEGGGGMVQNTNVCACVCVPGVSKTGWKAKHGSSCRHRPDTDPFEGNPQEFMCSTCYRHEGPRLEALSIAERGSPTCLDE